MDDAWNLLRAAAIEATVPLWTDFAREGRESAVFAPLARYPSAALWLAASLALSDDYIPRKLGAMLAGFVEDGESTGHLLVMLEHERRVFAVESEVANSVGEDIMFAATRWTQSSMPPVRAAGLHILAEMIRDALAGIPWNTAHWAAANLHHATEGQHEMLQVLAGAPVAQMQGQKFLQQTAHALRHSEHHTLLQFVTAPSPMQSLPPDDPNYAIMSSLWIAAETAEQALGDAVR